MTNPNLRITIREGEAATVLEFDTELLSQAVDTEDYIVEQFKRSLRAVREIAKLYELKALSKPEALTGDQDAVEKLIKSPVAPVKPEEIGRWADDGGPVT